MANCAVCREDIGSEKQCSRCGSDNSDVGDTTIGYFSSFWGILSFLLIFPPLFMLMPGVFTWVNNALQPVASIRVGGPIALLNTMVIAFYLFSMRDDLRDYSLTRSFKAQPGRSLPFLALVFFVIAILLAFFLGFGVTAKDSIVGPPGYSQSELRGMLVYGSTWHLLLKLAMTGFLVFIFVFFALSAGLMAAYEYSKYVDEHLPDPIYLNEQLLLHVVMNTVREELGHNVGLQMAGLSRLENGGISLNLNHQGEINALDGTILLEQKAWLVHADRWGRVGKMEESQRSIQMKK